MQSPFAKLFTKEPDCSGIKIFGCKCFHYLRKYGKDKFFPCVYIGYSLIHKGYRCLDPTTNRIYTYLDMQYLMKTSFHLTKKLTLHCQKIENTLVVTDFNYKSRKRIVSCCHHSPTRIYFLENQVESTIAWSIVAKNNQEFIVIMSQLKMI